MDGIFYTDTGEVLPIMIQEAIFDELEPEIDSMITTLKETEASFELVTRISKETILDITGMYQVIIECCPNRRVVPFILYGKKRRTRKKNLHRAIRVLEKGERQCP